MAIYLGNQKVSARGIVVDSSKLAQLVDGSITEIKASDLQGATALRRSAFSYCEKLESIELPTTLTSLGRSALGNCSSLKTVVIPDSVTFIGNSCFYEDYALEDVTIGNGVITIDSSAFSYCRKLQTIIIPNSVQKLENNALAYCSILKSITIGSGVTSIGSYCFSGCTALVSVYYTGTIDEWANITFLSDINANPLCNGADLYINNEKVTSATISKVKDAVFAGCRSLTSITIGNSVTSIGGYAFYNCVNLSSITIPNSVTSIGIGAFYGCTTLQSLTIGNSVTSIGNNALQIGSSTAKATIIMLPTTPPTIQSRTIGNYVEKIIVPKGTLSAYQSATNWSAKASVMEEATE